MDIFVEQEKSGRDRSQSCKYVANKNNKYVRRVVEGIILRVEK